MLNFERAPEHETDRQDFRAEDSAGHPLAMEAWLSGDWSRVEEREQEDVRAA